jgi:hypothetical protein
MNILHRINQRIFLPALPIIAVITGLVLVSNTAFADSRNNSRFSFNSNINNRFNKDSFNNISRGSFNSNYRNRNSGFQSNKNRFNSQSRHWNSRNFNTARYSNFNSSRNRFNSYNTYNSTYNSTYNPYGNPYRGNGWSVNLNLGNSWNGFSSFYSPLHTQTTRTRVIYTQPTVVVVDGGSRSTSYVNSTTADNYSDTYQRSLLRDLDGNCFERSYDDQGREIRIQLPNEECNF